MAILKSVKDKADAISVAEATNGYVDVSQSGDTYTLNVDSEKIDSTGAAIQASGTTDNGKLVTAGAVKAILDTDLTDSTNTATTVPTAAAVVTYAEAASNKATAIIPTGETGANVAAADGGNDKYPTTKAVYDFVTSQVGGAAYQPVDSAPSSNSAVSVSYNDGTDVGWGSLSGDGYVAISGASGVYTVNIDNSKVATSSDFVATVANDSTNTTTRAKLATAGTVYDFVSGGYQPKTTGTGVMVGYDGAWHSLTGDDYITVAADANGSSVTLTNKTGSTSDFVAAVASNDANYDTVSATRAKLAKSGDVYDFVTGLTGGLTIPEMPEGCDTVAQTGGYCALVYGVTSGTAGQQGATYGLQWTVMAPDTMPTGTGN
jgi:hypothetical protein